MSLQTTFVIYHEIGRKLSIENTEGKGQIALYEQFLLFPPCFQKTSTTDTEKPGLVWERVKGLTLHQITILFKKLFENFVEKG